MMHEAAILNMLSRTLVLEDFDFKEIDCRLDKLRPVSGGGGDPRRFNFQEYVRKHFAPICLKVN